MAVEILLGALRIIVFLLIIICYYAGFFRRVKIEKRNIGPFKVVYKEHRGPYKGTSKIQNEIYYKLLKDYKIATYRGIGIYYDNPKKTVKEELRSVAGCILEEKYYGKMGELKKEGFQTMTIAKGNFYVSEFPFKNSLSIIAGTMKVYPKFNKFMNKKGIKEKEMVEVYDVPNKKIIYMMKE